jgi:hypothetical protein
VTYKYSNGIELQIGDVVAMQRSDRQEEGTVVKIIQPNTPDAEAWSAPDGGILIESEGLGLSLTTSLEQDPDIIFVRRSGT